MIHIQTKDGCLWLTPEEASARFGIDANRKAPFKRKGGLIRKVRNDVDFSLGEAARALGMRTVDLSDFERGFANPPLKLVRALRGLKR